MPNAAEIIERMAGELEIYKLFATVKGFPNKEAVMKEVLAQLQRDTDEAKEE